MSMLSCEVWTTAGEDSSAHVKVGGILYPKYEVCYVMPLSSTLPSPRKANAIMSAA